jgi:uncharacterized protein YeaO (DUF488 family)
MKIAIKRAYDDAAPGDGYRVLVDRVWPRGRTKDELKLDEWAKALAPSAGLRKWFGHDPQRWPAFQERYRRELSASEPRQRLRALLLAPGKRPLTLVYGARDPEHNQAVVLRDVLSQMAKGK